MNREIILTAYEAASYLLGKNAETEDLEFFAKSIKEQARNDPGKLGFPVTVVGMDVLIPKRKFFEFFGIEEGGEEDEEG